MAKYRTTWLDGKLPTGQIFSVAVCGYSGKIRHMIIGEDPMRHTLMRFESVDGNQCQTAEHCLAKDCLLNKTEYEHTLHMLDMYYEEKLDPETADRWTTDSVVEGLIKFAEKMNESVPAELRRGMNQVDPDETDTSQSKTC
jgi:hypothetical protein